MQVVHLKSKDFGVTLRQGGSQPLAERTLRPDDVGMVRGDVRPTASVAGDMRMLTQLAGRLAPKVRCSTNQAEVS